MKFDLHLPLVMAEEGEEPTEGKRTISGIALPWETEASVSTGQRVSFAKGSVSLADVPVVLFHAPDRPVGVVADENDGDGTLRAEARISKTRDGDEALVLAADKVLRGFSVGVNPTEFEEREDGSLYVTAAAADHLALVTSPAFADAKVEKVAASAARQKEEAVAVPTTTQEETPAVVAAAPRTPAVNATMPSLGEWMQAESEKNKRPEQFAAMQARIQAAAGHITSDKTESWNDFPFIGSTIDLFAPAARPLATALGVRSGPAGVKSFARPTVIGHLAAATTGAEKSDMTDDGINVDWAQVDYTFIKRSANVSIEAQVLNSADTYGIVGRDLIRAYLLGFEQVVSTALEGGTYDAITLAADGSDAVEKLAAGALVKYGKTFMQPDLLVMAPDVWAKFVGMTDSTGRQLFPVINPQNASGTTGGVTSWSLNLPGMRSVVVPTLTAGKAFLCVSEYVEVYEANRVSMGPVQEPTVLGTAWGVAGAVGTFIVDAAVSTVAVV